MNNGPPAPVVLTAGGPSRGIMGFKKPSLKKGGKKNKSKAKGQQLKVQINDEEETDMQFAVSPDSGGSTPTKDNRLNTTDTGIDGAAASTSDSPSSGSTEPMDEAEGDENIDRRRELTIQRASVKLDDLYKAPPLIVDDAEVEEASKSSSKKSDLFWLAFCFFGIMGSFVAYGLLLEYATSGGKHLHELSFLFVTSLLYTLTARVGRYVRGEEESTIPPAQFAVLGMTSMGSTFFSVRALRYVIYPIQVLAKSCKPVPVMLMGALMGKKYPFKKYVKVCLIVGGVAMFMVGGNKKKGGDDDGKDASTQVIGVGLLFISLCFDGGTGAYEDKLMSVHSVQPFDLMYNIQMGKTILAGIGLIVLNQVHVFAQMCQDMGFLLVALGLTGAIGQVFIFVTISKFGALTCSIIGLARKITTLVASIWYYGHSLNNVQALGLFIAVGAMVQDFFGKKGKGGGHGHGGGHGGGNGDSKEEGFKDEEKQPMLAAAEEGEEVEASADENAASQLEMGAMKR